MTNQLKHAYIVTKKGSVIDMSTSLTTILNNMKKHRHPGEVLAIRTANGEQLGNVEVRTWLYIYRDAIE